MQDEGMVNQGDLTTKNQTVVTNIFAETDSDGDLVSDISPPPVSNEESPENQQPINEQNNDIEIRASEEEFEYINNGSPSTSIITNEDERAGEAMPDMGSEDEREMFYIKYSDYFENWQYSEDERKWLRYKVETLSRNQCVVFCVLGHMVMTRDEMTGMRHALPSSEEARQALLKLSVGSQWDVRNLAILMAFQDKVDVVDKYVSTLLIANPNKARSLIKAMLTKIL